MHAGSIGSFKMSPSRIFLLIECIVKLMIVFQYLIGSGYDVEFTEKLIVLSFFIQELAVNSRLKFNCAHLAARTQFIVCLKRRIFIFFVKKPA